VTARPLPAAHREGYEKEQYLVTTRLIERLHRRFLDVIKTELDRLGIQDVNNVQTLILFNINEDQLTVGELTVRGYYLGSNVSYNVKKLVENGYLIQERSAHDRRQTRVRLSQKGLDITARIDQLYRRNAEELAGTLDEDQLKSLNGVLLGLERYWSSLIKYDPTFA
jgi:DNA-binding MarR family transcriptional regulator